MKRKRSLLSSLLYDILSYPVDVYYSINESIADFTSSNDRVYLASPIAVSLDFLLFLLVHLDDLDGWMDFLLFGVVGGRSSGIGSSGSDGSDWESSFMQTDDLESSWSWIRVFAATGIGLVSVGNAYWMASRYRKYRLFNAKEEPKSPNAKVVSVADADDNYDESDHGQSWLTPRILVAIYNLLVASFRTESDDDDLDADYYLTSPPGRKATGSQLYVWELSMWEPSDFNLSFFCDLNPLHCFIIVLMREQAVASVILCLLLSQLLRWLVTRFQTLIADKQIHFEQVYHEYNVKFVNRRLFVQKQDVGTDPKSSMK